jgi:hypothetical protein
LNDEPGHCWDGLSTFVDLNSTQMERIWRLKALNFDLWTMMRCTTLPEVMLSQHGTNEDSIKRLV